MAATGFSLGRFEHPHPHPTTSFPSSSPKKRRSLFRGSYSSSPLSRVVDMNPSPNSDSTPATPTSLRPMTAHVSSSHHSHSIFDNTPPPPVNFTEPYPCHPSSDRVASGKPLGRRRRSTYTDSNNNNNHNNNHHHHHNNNISRGNHDIATATSNQVSGTGRPSSSWVRRLSLISSSQNGTCLDSPSFPGSASHFSLCRPDTAPNKLVKRPTSHRGANPSQSAQTFGPSSNTPFLRRPATSHQRSATMRQRSLTDSRLPLDSTVFHGPSHDARPSEQNNSASHGLWRPYFFASAHPMHSDKPPRPSSSRYSSGHVSRRFTFGSSNFPTLLLASSITPWEPGASSRNAAHSAFDSETTPFGPSPTVTENVAAADGNNEKKLGRKKSRQSFSAGGFVSRGASVLRRSSTTKSFGRNRAFSHSQEQSNATPYGVQDFRTPTKSEKLLYTSPNRARRRKNIAETGVFDRPHTSSYSEVYPDSTDFTSTSPRSRLRRLPNFTDLRVGVNQAPTSYTPPLEIESRPSSSDHIRHSPEIDPSPPAPAVVSLRTQRLSAAASDPASTLIGSDNDTRIFSSGDEDETDFHSDTVFDSFPTHTGNSNNQKSRGPRIETIFDEPSPSELTRGKPTTLEQLISNSKRGNSTADETGDADNKLDTLSYSPCPVPTTISSPTSQKRESSYGSGFSSLPESDGTSAHAEFSSSNGPANLFLAKRENGYDDDLDGTLQTLSELSLNHTDKAPPIEVFDTTTSSITSRGRSASKGRSIFDWSEQQRNENDPSGTACRPKTVHGKETIGTRGGRTTTRSPSAVHLRSQSVPLSRDPNEAHPSAKFGSWGLGNKGVTEDWDGDFEFDEEPDKQDDTANGLADTDAAFRSSGMKVPQSIMERQASVHGQFGHVQELTLLVEELKRLRARAATLDIINGPSNELWREAKGIVSLATFEDEAEDDGESAIESSFEPTFGDDEPENESYGYSPNRVSDISRSPLTEKTNSSSLNPIRPRTESSVKARHVLDTIYKQRGDGQGTDFQQKLPFDTQSLRDLVVRAGVVTRALKDCVRKAEGVSDTTDAEIQSSYPPPISQVFARPIDDAQTNSCPGLATPKDKNGGYGGFPADIDYKENDPRESFAMMAVV